NLGGWFCAESWMQNRLWSSNGCSTSSVYGQWQLERCLGSKASSVLKTHWSTWFTESDFSAMSAAGINLLRLPVGWWNIYDPLGGVANAKLNWTVSQRNYTTGSLQYIDLVFQWATKYNIAILIGIHAAPGSQNGQDHSSPEVYNQIGWGTKDTVGQTLDSIENYAIRYANSPALFGFYLLNEPHNPGVDPTIMGQYYQDAYARIRKKSSDSVIVLNPFIAPFQTGTESMWTGFMNPSGGYTNVWMDLHVYFCFGGNYNSADQNSVLSYINGTVASTLTYYNKVNPKPLLIGEWSGCNGFNNPQAIIRAQLDVFKIARGWTFWSWTDGSYGNSWSMKSCLRSDTKWITSSDLKN
ncbi:putative glucan 1,3-beta-glucosidase, partial [Planoprotostelium fungivorum]